MTVGDRVIDLDRFRQPEYVGENRCIPCTIVNVALALYASVALAVLVTFVGPASVAALVGVGAFALCGAAIYLRGYLVPGTPTLTKRYLPDRVLAAFDKEPGTTGLTGTDDAASVETSGAAETNEAAEAGAVAEAGAAAEADEAAGAGAAEAGPAADESAPEPPGEPPEPATVLAEAGVITECEQVDDLCLTDEFRAAWNSEIREVRNGDVQRRLLGEALGVDPDALTFDEYGNAFNARINGSRVGQWESHAALVADLGAAQALEPRYDRWGALPTDAQGSVLYSLRSFLETCPECEGRVMPERDTVESCCRTTDVVAMSCEDCGARVLETELEEAD
ncbi:MAG: hypothetical protein ABEI80_00270 [Haloplanus sp.]